MKCFEFTITLVGYSDTGDRDDAWRDAVEGFNLDPGIPDPHNTTEEIVNE